MQSTSRRSSGQRAEVTSTPCDGWVSLVGDGFFEVRARSVLIG
jgi:hypothetical protein